jgi:superfamily II DNA or RNA helicase
MSDVIKIKKINEVYNKLVCDPGIGYELSDYFAFDVPGAKFMPSYKNKMWDGKIRLYNLMTSTLYSGLNKYVEEFCKSRNYELEYETDFGDDEFSVIEAKQFIATLNIPEKFEIRDYQVNAFVHAVRKRRSLILSPTGSGKSLIIYFLLRYYEHVKTLIIVPTTALVHQLATDFKDYGYKEEVHKIFSEQEKESKNSEVTISTWQSIFKLPKSWFKKYGAVIGDECHIYKAKSLIAIMTKLEECQYRFGLTGTLDDTLTHKLVLEGLFGTVLKGTSTSELIEQKYLSEFKIKALVLAYSDEERQLATKNKTYQSEMDFLVSHKKRNNFIKNLSLSLNGNTLLLFQYVEKHGQYLYDIIKKESKDRKIFFVHGGVPGKDRNTIRKIIEQEKNAIIIGSYGTFSQGINVPSIENIIFGSPAKSRIRVLQSIGRGVRTAKNKKGMTLFDIADDLSWKKRRNHTLNHMIERVKIYNEEKFPYRLYKIQLSPKARK